jgi:hypothetical protein
MTARSTNEALSKHPSVLMLRALRSALSELALIPSKSRDMTIGNDGPARAMMAGARVVKPELMTQAASILDPDLRVRVNVNTTDATTGACEHATTDGKGTLPCPKRTPTENTRQNQKISKQLSTSASRCRVHVPPFKADSGSPNRCRNDVAFVSGIGLFL